MGRQDHSDDVDRVQGAARIARAEVFLGRLPAGYDSVLSSAFLGGCELSVSQWHRVALARAVFRDAPLVILDEPTASLDARAEHELFEQGRELFGGRGVLLISHRFSSVRWADRIYVLADGAVVESGDHDSLEEAGDRYAELFDMQTGTPPDGCPGPEGASRDGSAIPRAEAASTRGSVIDSAHEWSRGENQRERVGTICPGQDTFPVRRSRSRSWRDGPPPIGWLTVAHPSEQVQYRGTS
ncbi:MAG: ABC transporter ATP-binding protein [Acidimicrobiales bacterium]|nr:ABC transporter ATP-binding protein [Acidimicrobiales bacterium]